MAFKRRSRRGGTHWVAGTLILVVLGGLGWGAYLAGNWLFQHNADVRRWYNVSRADPYRYEETRPLHSLTDSASLAIDLTSDRDITTRRRAMSQAIFGLPAPPLWAQPAQVDRSIPLGDIPSLAPYRDLTVLMGVDRLTIPVDAGFTSVAYHLRPVDPRGKLVIWQQGYAATIADAAPMLVPLLERGYDVVALNNVGVYGENQLNAMDLPRYGHLAIKGRLFLSALPYPLRRFLLPSLVAANFALQELGQDHYAMAGISAGGWITVVQAALDTRILRSYPMAGAYPLTYQQEDDHPPPAEQYYPALVQAASYAEMFVMAAHGEGRGQIQFFGQYDRCCQNNRIADLYAPAVADKVKALGPGSFKVHINDTSPDHTINPDYVTGILDDLITLE